MNLSKLHKLVKSISNENGWPLPYQYNDKNKKDRRVKYMSNGYDPSQEVKDSVVKILQYELSGFPFEIYHSIGNAWRGDYPYLAIRIPLDFDPVLLANLKETV